MKRSVLIEEVGSEAVRIAEREALRGFDVPQELAPLLTAAYASGWLSGFTDVVQEAAFETVGEKFENRNDLGGYEDEIDNYMRRFARRVMRQRREYEDAMAAGDLDDIIEDLRRKYEKDDDS